MGVKSSSFKVWKAGKNVPCVNKNSCIHLIFVRVLLIPFVMCCIGVLFGKRFMHTVWLEYLKIIWLIGDAKER